MTEASEELWFYAGRRLDQKGKVFYAWLDGNGEMLHYDKLSASWVGGVYAVSVTRTEESTKVTISPGPRFVRDEPADPPANYDRDLWVAEDNAAYARVEAKRAEAMVARAGRDLDHAVNVIRRYKSKLRSYSSQQAFWQWLEGELMKPYKEEE